MLHPAGRKSEGHLSKTKDFMPQGSTVEHVELLRRVSWFALILEIQVTLEIQYLTGTSAADPVANYQFFLFTIHTMNFPEAPSIQCRLDILYQVAEKVLVDHILVLHRATSQSTLYRSSLSNSRGCCSQKVTFSGKRSWFGLKIGKTSQKWCSCVSFAMSLSVTHHFITMWMRVMTEEISCPHPGNLSSVPSTPAFSKISWWTGCLHVSVCLNIDQYRSDGEKLNPGHIPENLQTPKQSQPLISQALKIA